MSFIGIDFGTSTTLVSRRRGNSLVLVPLADNQDMIESVIRLNVTKDKLLEQNYKDIIIEDFGNSAWRNFREFKGTTFIHFKPEIGEDPIKTKVAKLWCQKIYELFCCNQNQGNDLSRCSFVFGVPAKWTKEQRQTFRNILSDSGFINIHLVPEPIAAILSSNIKEHLENHQVNSNILLFDFGGGSLDLSLIKKENGLFKIKYSGGNSKLGGRDFNEKINKYILEEAKKEGVIITEYDNIEQDVNSIFSNKENCKISFKNDIYHLSRDKFEEICNKEIENIYETLNDFFNELKCNSIDVDKNEIQEVFKVGGASALFFIDKLLKEYFGQELKINNSLQLADDNPNNILQQLVVKGLPMYLMKREDLLQQHRVNVQTEYNVFINKFNSKIDNYVKNVNSDFDKRFKKYESKYSKILNAINKADCKKKIDNKFFVKATKSYLKKLNSDIEELETDLNNLLNRAYLFIEDDFGLLPEKKDNSIEINPLKFQTLADYNYHPSRWENLISILTMPFTKLYGLFNLEIWKVKSDLKSLYVNYFSMQKPVENKGNWQKDGGFFYVVKSDIKIISWEKFWDKFQDKFQIIGGNNE